MALEINEKNFETEVIKSDIPVMVDFWAEWCGPCQIMGPIIDDLAKQYAGKIKIAKINVDENQVLASKYSIMSIPSMLVFKGGKIIGQSVGARPKKDIVELLEKSI